MRIHSSTHCTDYQIQSADSSIVLLAEIKTDVHNVAPDSTPPPLPAGEADRKERSTEYAPHRKRGRVEIKGEVVQSSHSYSFHPTVLLEKALSTASGPAVSGSGFRADLLRGRGAPIQSVIKHTAHLADPAPPAVPSPALRSNTERPYSVLSAWVSHHINTQG
ncbi:hypothetical protein NQZ68_006160 [Dissostichus eleginoides]|nr:hypothetical protein NQZ68_006160 [Dissostichus eleginoides]